MGLDLGYRKGRVCLRGNEVDSRGRLQLHEQSQTPKHRAMIDDGNNEDGMRPAPRLEGGGLSSKIEVEKVS